MGAPGEELGEESGEVGTAPGEETTASVGADEGADAGAGGSAPGDCPAGWIDAARQATPDRPSRSHAEASRPTGTTGAPTTRPTGSPITLTCTTEESRPRRPHRPTLYTVCPD